MGVLVKYVHCTLWVVGVLVIVLMSATKTPTTLSRPYLKDESNNGKNLNLNDLSVTRRRNAFDFLLLWCVDGDNINTLLNTSHSALIGLQT